MGFGSDATCNTQFPQKQPRSAMKDSPVVVTSGNLAGKVINCRGSGELRQNLVCLSRSSAPKVVPLCRRQRSRDSHIGKQEACRRQCRQQQQQPRPHRNPRWVLPHLPLHRRRQTYAALPRSPSPLLLLPFPLSARSFPPTLFLLLIRFFLLHLFLRMAVFPSTELLGARLLKH